MGNWQIAVSQKAGPGCVATRHFVNPTSQVQMGINATSTPPSGFLAIYVEGYEGIQPGQSIPATFAVGDREFKGTFTGAGTAGFGGASVPVDRRRLHLQPRQLRQPDDHLWRRPPGHRAARRRRRGHRGAPHLSGRPRGEVAGGLAIPVMSAAGQAADIISRCTPGRTRPTQPCSVTDPPVSLRRWAQSVAQTPLRRTFQGPTCRVPVPA